MADDVNLREIVSKITERYSGVLEMENEITTDFLSYTSWVIALTTAGLGMAILKGADLAARSWLPTPVATWTFVGIAVLLLVSIILGAVVRWTAMAEMNHQRVVLTLLAAQEANTIAGVVTDEALKGVAIAGFVPHVITGQFLPDESQKQFKEAEKEAQRLGARASALSMTQQVCTALAFAGLIAASISPPAWRVRCCREG